MNGPGNQLLAGSCFAKNENRGIGCGDLFNLKENVFQGITGADNMFIVTGQVDFFTKTGTFCFELFFILFYFIKSTAKLLFNLFALRNVPITRAKA